MRDMNDIMYYYYYMIHYYIILLYYFYGIHIYIGATLRHAAVVTPARAARTPGGNDTRYERREAVLPPRAASAPTRHAWI